MYFSNKFLLLFVFPVFFSFPNLGREPLLVAVFFTWMEGGGGRLTQDELTGIGYENDSEPVSLAQCVFLKWTCL